MSQSPVPVRGRGQPVPGPVRVTADFWEMVCGASWLGRCSGPHHWITVTVTTSQSVSSSPDCSFVQLAVAGERLGATNQLFSNKLLCLQSEPPQVHRSTLPQWLLSLVLIY